MVNLQSGVRSQQELADLQTVSLEDMIDHIEANDFQLVEGANKDYVRLVNTNTKQYFSIGISKKLDLGDAKGVDKIKAVINSDAVIYTGETEEGNVWFTFAPEPSQRDTVVVSIASIMGGVKAA